MARDLIGSRIKALREAGGLSQHDVARLLGFNDKQTISTIELGTRRLTAQELQRAAEKLGVPVDNFADSFRLDGEGRFSWRQSGVTTTVPSRRYTLRWIVTLALLFTVSLKAWAGSIEGELVLYPQGCQSKAGGICKLGSELTYTSSRNRLVWKTNAWSSDEAQSGTTDGASIPKWARPIIGEPYEGAYLKASIIHDHYCYKENHVRSWRDTHRMYYDAMLDSGVDSNKAKVMYFAVYLAGPKWVKLVKGENCGTNCIQNMRAHPNVSSSNVFLEKSLLNSSSHQEEVLRLHEEFESGKDYSIEELEAHAISLDTNKFFYRHRHLYHPTGDDDPNLMNRL